MTGEEDGDVTGGYLLELDMNYDEVNKFHSALKGYPYMLKSPEEDALTPKQFDYIRDYVAEMEDALYDEERFSRGDFTEYLDMESFANYLIVMELTGNTEYNFPKSVYLHKDKGGKMKAGPVWDFDISTFSKVSPQSSSIDEAPYLMRLLESPLFLTVLQQRWKMHYPRLFEVGGYIRITGNRLVKSQDLNCILWPLSISSNGDEFLPYPVAVERMVQSYESKLLWMDEQIMGAGTIKE